MALFDGILVGLGMMLFIGPVFFTLLQSTLRAGFGAGFMVALGIFISDVVCVALCYMGASAFLNDSYNKIWMSIIGCIILLGIGIKYIVSPAMIEREDSNHQNLKGSVAFFTKGFLINFVNPFVFAVWLTVIAHGKAHYETKTELWTYLGAALMVVLITDTLKSALANKIKAIIQPKILTTTYKVIGIILLIFAIRLAVYAVKLSL